MTTIGATIVDVREMTDEEYEENGWYKAPGRGATPVVVFDDGSKMYPSMDGEGNGPGMLFGNNPDGEPVYVHAALEEASN